MNAPYISVKDVVKGYNIGKTRVEVLRDINLEIQKGEFVALLGSSGCGKTTLLNLLGTLERPEEGEITCDGNVFSKMSNRACSQFRSLRIGFVFQSYHLIPEINVLSNILIANKMSPKPDSKAKERALALLDRLGLSQRIKHHPYELSGGEQQRVAIARALINNPDLILADEPTGNLDRASGEGILEIFTQIRKDLTQRPTIVMVTHDEHIASFADRIIRLADGHIIPNV